MVNRGSGRNAQPPDMQGVQTGLTLPPPRNFQSGTACSVVD